MELIEYGKVYAIPALLLIGWRGEPGVSASCGGRQGQTDTKND